MKIKQNNIEQPLGRILSFAGRNFLHLLNTKLENLDIERNFYALLLVEQHNGEITQQDLAEKLSTDKVSIVRTINYLSKNEYIKRTRNINDKRKYSLEITDKAKKSIPTIKQALNESTDIAFKSLNNYQISEFYKTLNVIKNNLKKHNNTI